MQTTAKKVLWIKVVFHIIALMPLLYLFLAVNSNVAGGDPVQYIIHYTGKGALNALVAGLLISPIAQKFKLGWLMQTRRLVGLWAFTYASLHLLSYFSLDLIFAWKLLFSEVVKRPYILVGSLAWLILLALSITSFKKIQRKMGRNWQKLHNMVYLAALLAPIHYYWSVKSEVIEPTIYILIMLMLLAVRWQKLKRI